MKFFTAISLIIIGLLGVYVPNVPSCAHSGVFFANIGNQYRRFSDIKPKIVNEVGNPIYLSWRYPNGPFLMRLNEQTGEWEAGGTGIVCSTGAGNAVAINPSATVDLPLEWEMSTDDFHDPQLFELTDHETHRPLTGRYKIVVRYTLDEWSRWQRPKEILVLESSEFDVAW